jgi:hypothetical protein
MESVRITIPIPADVDPGSYIRIYGSPPGGAIDFTESVSGNLPIYPPQAHIPTHLDGRHLLTRHLIGVGYGGHLDGVHLEHKHLDYQDVVEWQGGQFYGPYGGSKLFSFGAKIFDKRGRVSASVPTTTPITINTSPRAVTAFDAASLSGGAITFSFTKSADL